MVMKFTLEKKVEITLLRNRIVIVMKKLTITMNYLDSCVIVTEYFENCIISIKYYYICVIVMKYFDRYLIVMK